MNRRTFSRLAVLGVTVMPGSFRRGFAVSISSGPDEGDKLSKRAALAREILADATLGEVYGMAQRLLRGGLNAGDNYRTTWIRDMNTFIEVGLTVNPPQRYRDALLMFFKMQGPGGDIPDLYTARDPASIKPSDRTSPLAPGYVAAKNTVETDQESSLVQAVYQYITVTGDRAILEQDIGGIRVRERMAQAMQYVLTERFDPVHDLVWGGTTIDWGDVQPESPHGTVLDASSHRALSIYDNAMLLVALNNYLELLADDPDAKAHWQSVRDRLHANIRTYLWDERRQKFIPHVYLDGSPFPKSFDENAIYYHGGTAVAIQAGLLSREEVAGALERMEEDVRQAGAATIGLTIYPPYPLGYFKNPELTVPYTYQNGGDWSWFGGRMIQQLMRYEMVEEAYRNLRPMVERVKRVGDFYEWWTRDNQPRGSAQFRGSAGVLGKSIESLRAWARQRI